MKRQAIVTGHSRGLGAAMTRLLLERGYAVLGLSRQSLDLPGELHQVSLDLGDTKALTDWLAGAGLHEFLADSGQALLINNAGTVQPIGPAGSHAMDDTVRALALNIAAPLLLTDAFVAASTHCPDRRILHISSGAGRNAYPGWNLYCAGKAALDRHAEAVALERLAGLRIASLAPGVVDTGMQDEIRASSDELFPLRARFVDLKTRGHLADPALAGCATVDYLLGQDFAASPLVDLRDLLGRS